MVNFVKTSVAIYNSVSMACLPLALWKQNFLFMVSTIKRILREKMLTRYLMECKTRRPLFFIFSVPVVFLKFLSKYDNMNWTILRLPLMKLLLKIFNYSISKSRFSTVWEKVADLSFSFHRRLVERVGSVCERKPR